MGTQPGVPVSSCFVPIGPSFFFLSSLPLFLPFFFPFLSSSFLPSLRFSFLPSSFWDGCVHIQKNPRWATCCLRGIIPKFTGFSKNGSVRNRWSHMIMGNVSPFCCSRFLTVIKTFQKGKPGGEGSQDCRVLTASHSGCGSPHSTLSLGLLAWVPVDQHQAGQEPPRIGGWAALQASVGEVSLDPSCAPHLLWLGLPCKGAGDWFQ